MNLSSILAIAIGATSGALLRWRLSLWLNSSSLNALPLGTLAANLIGCFCIGVALTFRLPEFWKLMLITGFLGSLTTFSTFTAEWLTQLERGQWSSSLWILLLHLAGGAFCLLLGAAVGRIWTS